MKMNRIVAGIFSVMLVFQNAFATVPTPDFDTIKQAQKLLPANKQKQANLATIRVRAELNDLLAGDFVTTVVVYGKAGQPGARLELIADQTIIESVLMPATLGEVGFTLNMRNGVDYQRLLLRSVGKTEIQVITANVGDPDSDSNLPPPLNPPPVEPPPVVVPTTPVQGPGHLNEFTANCKTRSNGVVFFDDTEAGAIWFCKNAQASVFQTDARVCEAMSECKNPRMQCSTSSNGLPFIAYSLADVVRKCQTHPSTNPSECNNFARCEGSNNGPFPPPFPPPPPQPPVQQCNSNFDPNKPCQTKSNGCKYSAFFLDQVIEQCQFQAPFVTNSEECRTVAFCNGDQGQPQPPPFPGGGHVGPLPGGHTEGDCRTGSKGYFFEGPTREWVVQQCKAHPITNNSECEMNVNPDCGHGGYGGHGGHHGPGGHHDHCFAESHGLIFEGPNREQAAARCRAHSQTNNTECNDSALVNCDF